MTIDMTLEHIDMGEHCDQNSNCVQDACEKDKYIHGTFVTSAHALN